MDYDKTIAKFNRGGRDKLAASHELICSVHDYVYYLLNKYYRDICHHSEDILHFCHLYLLSSIHQFNSKKGRFITWARYRILNGIAIYMEQYYLTVNRPRHAKQKGINIFIEYIDINYILCPEETIADVDARLDRQKIIDKIGRYVIEALSQKHWNMFKEFYGLGMNNPVRLKDMLV